MRRAVTKLISNKSNIFSPGVGQDNTNYRIDFSSVKDFYIVLDKPHQSWKPGDEVSGQIIFISKKNLANIFITLSLIGCVKVNAIHHSKLRPVKHNLFNHTITIYGEDQQGLGQGNDDFENGLYKGEHRFPFIVKLPVKKVFTSIDFGKGSIKYLLKASIGNLDFSNSNSLPNQTTSSPESPNSVVTGNNLTNKTKTIKKRQNATYTSEKIINLIKPIDVAKLESPKPKRLIIKDPKRNKMLSRTHSSTSTINTFNTVGSISSNNSDSYTPPDTVSSTNTPTSHPNTPGDTLKPETIKVSLEIPDKGYLRGELIPIKLTINHLKKIQDLNGIIITLVRVCRLDNGMDGLFESFRKDLQQVVIPLYVDPVTYQSEINTSIRVPADAFPTISDCPLVSFQYFTEVLINLSGKSLILENKNFVNLNNLPDSLNVDFKIPGDFKFNFNSSNNYQAERSGFINTDKFKRMRKFVQMTNEVVIGTFRLEPEQSRTLHSENNNMSTNSISDSSSPVGLDLTDPSLIEPPSTNPYTPLVSNVSDSNNEATPPYLMNSPSEVNASPIPDYDEIRNSYQNQNILPDSPSHVTSEKDQIRAYESTLLPSEPQLNDIDEEHITELTIAPRDNLLDNISERDETRSTVPDDASDQKSNQYQFFSEHNSLATLTQDEQDKQDEQDEQDEQDQQLRDIHDAEDIDQQDLDDQYSAIDYVPNYDSFRDDKPIVPNDVNKCISKQ